jgi:hypothetical protein
VTVNYRADVAPANLGDALELVKAMFSHAGSGVPIQIGAHYDPSKQGGGPGAGNPPKITFIPEQRGRIGSAITHGNVASWYHGCDVLVRARPGSTDEQRFKFAYDLADKVIAALASAASGRIEFGSVEDDSPATTDHMGGVGLRFSFVFRRDVAQWDQLWTLPQPVDGLEKPLHTPLELSGSTIGEPPDQEDELTGTANVIPTTIPEE